MTNSKKVYTLLFMLFATLTALAHYRHKELILADSLIEEDIKHDNITELIDGETSIIKFNIFNLIAKVEISIKDQENKIKEDKIKADAEINGSIEQKAEISKANEASTSDVESVKTETKESKEATSKSTDTKKETAQDTETKAETNKVKESSAKPNVASSNTSSNEVEILYRITEAEVTGGSANAKKNVASVIINRTKSSKFPNSIEGVVFQKGQFSPISDGRYYSIKITEETKSAVNSVLNNGVTNDALFFCNQKDVKSLSTKKWFKSLSYLFKDDSGHSFYK